MRGSGPRVYYKLRAPIHGVKLESRPGSTMRDPTQDLVLIPTEATIELETISAPASGLVDVLWNGGAYAVYYGDLQEKAQIVTAGK